MTAAKAFEEALRAYSAVPRRGVGGAYLSEDLKLLAKRREALNRAEHRLNAERFASGQIELGDRVGDYTVTSMSGGSWRLEDKQGRPSFWPTADVLKLTFIGAA